MTTQTAKGYITRTQFWHGDPPTYGFSQYKPMPSASPSTVVVREHTIEFDVDDNFDPRDAQVEALREYEKSITADFHVEVTKVQDRINKLLALEYGND